MNASEIDEQLAVAIKNCETNQFDSAEAVCQRILQLSPNHEQTLNLLAGIYHQRGDLPQAVQLWKKVLTINPQLFIAHYNLGISYYEQQQFDEASSHFTHAVNLNPANLAALTNLANSLLALDKYQQVIDVYQKILAIAPNNLDILLRRANLYLQFNQYVSALEDLRKVLSIDKHHVSALNNIGLTLVKLGRFEEAVAYYDDALKIAPTESVIWMNRAAALSALSKDIDAIASYQQAAKVDPHNLNVKGILVQELQQICDWKNFDEYANDIKKLIRLPSDASKGPLHASIPFLSLVLPNLSLQEQLICAQKYIDDNFSALSKYVHPKRDQSPRKLRIGYLSGDFRRHAVAQLMVEVFELHDATRFTVFAFSYGPNDGSQLRNRIRNAVPNFIDISSLDNKQAAEVIHNNHIDILIDLSGHTGSATDGTRTAILALRPAPIQISYLGYLGTTGANFIDYLIADDYLIHPDEECYFTEKIIRLRNYQANDSQCEIGPESTRQENGLPENGVVFCSFNMTYKITPDIFDKWCALLSAVPGSVLWLYAMGVSAITNLKKEAHRRGIDPTRLIFASMVDLSAHLSRLRCADIFLDTHPYNAGTTASNALWVGLPVVTCSGKTFASRMAGSLLKALDVPELITHNLDDYFTLALTLATHPEKRKVIHEKILANKTTALLFDSKAFTKDLENAFCKVWGTHE